VLLCGTAENETQLREAMEYALHDVDVFTSLETISVQDIAHHDVILLSPTPEEVPVLRSLCERIRKTSACRHIPIIVYLSLKQEESIPLLSGIGIDEIFAFTPLFELRDLYRKLDIIHRRCRILQKLQEQLELFQDSDDVPSSSTSDVRYRLFLSSQAIPLFSAILEDDGLVDLCTDLDDLEQSVDDEQNCILVIDLALGTKALKIASKINTLQPEIPTLLLIPRQSKSLVEQCSDLGLGNILVYPEHVLLIDNKIAQLKRWGHYHHYYQQHFQAQLGHAIRDELTGFCNRRYLDQLLKYKINKQNSFAFLMLDIDHFKAVNDDHGHLFGDEVLRCLAGRMMQQFRPSDIVGRWGGEEFVIVLDNNNSDLVFNLAERLRHAIGDVPMEIMHPGGHLITKNVTISIGIAISRADDTLSSITDRADKCLYLAKEQGRNCTVYQDDLE
jgi:diguanylate cyclase (GGDEF)-like protein